jgi:hypothetical protein
MSNREFDAMVKVNPQLARVNFARWIVARTIDSAEEELEKLQKTYQKYLQKCAKRRWYRLWNQVTPVSFQEFFIGVARDEHWWASMELHFLWQQINHWASDNVNKIRASHDCEAFYANAQRWGAVCSWAETYPSDRWPSRAKALEEVCALIESSFIKMKCVPTVSPDWLRRTIAQAIEIAQEEVENED